MTRGKKNPPVVTGPPGEEIDKKEDKKDKTRKNSITVLKKFSKDSPEEIGQSGDEPASSSDEESSSAGFGDGIRGSRPPVEEVGPKGKDSSKLKGKKILEN